MLELYLKLRIAAMAVGLGAVLALFLVWICVKIHEKRAQKRRRNKKKPG